MPGIFDRLNKEIKDSQRQEGISPLDIAQLPPAMRKIMRLMLREVQAPYALICETMEKVAEQERLSRSALDDALAALTEQGWLIQIGAGEKALYKVNLRRKEGSALMSGIWSSLDTKLKKDSSDKS
ncbi:MAG: hypothetical protein LC099_10390 [Anaerolineales bacterium]|nr:hypothetical protein [Anaerolineales bacterium]